MTNTSPRSDIQDIELTNLVETKENEEIFGIDENQVTRLAQEIKENGFTGSIDVMDLENGTYQIFSGHQRYRAMKILGKDRIPCTVYPKMAESELNRKLIASNILTRKLTPLIMAKAIKAYEEKTLNGGIRMEKGRGEKREALMSYFNMGKVSLSQHQAILAMPKGIQELCNNQMFPFRELVEAVGFNDEQKKELEERVKTDVSEKTLENYSRIHLRSTIEDIRRREEAKKRADEIKERSAQVIEEYKKKEGSVPVPEFVKSELQNIQVNDYDETVDDEDYEDEEPDLLPAPDAVPLPNSKPLSAPPEDVLTAAATMFDAFPAQTPVVARNTGIDDIASSQPDDPVIESIRAMLEGVVSKKRRNIKNKERVKSQLEDCARFIMKLIENL